ncbi:MAG: arylsulfotransferase family protein [Solirubrobacterales bacterium]
MTTNLALPVLLILISLASGASSATAKTLKATVSPGPTAENASVWTEISFRGVTKSKAGKIVVRGSETGKHGYNRRRHSDNKGFSLVMGKPFETSERVSVRTSLNIPGADRGDYKFKVENLGGPRVKRVGNAALGDPGPQQFRSRPNLRPFTLNVRKSTDEAGDDPIFMGSKQRGAAIFAANGNPIWFQSMRSTDFRTQTYKGKPVLTWCEAPTKGSGTNRSTYVIANNAYKVIDRFVPGNGYAADSHELRLTDRGTAYITTYRTVKRDLRPIGFDKNGRVSDSVVQELDLATGRVIWEWHSLDHVPVRRSYADGPRRPGNPYDYFHVNSIIDTPDGNVMVSGRSTNTIYKVSRRSGRIIWELGGKTSDYKFGPGALFSWQHDAQPLSGNRVSLFDNSDAPVAAAPWADESRGLILKLNNKRMTANVDQEFIHPNHPLAPTQANLQRLPSGNFMVGWGQSPLTTEHAPDGTVVFDANVRGASSIYRTYRQPWIGRPTGPVAMATERSGNSASAWVSWNGDTEVDRWRVLTGSRASTLTTTKTVNRTGFETRIKIGPLASGAASIQIKGLNAAGKVIGSTAISGIG